MFDIVLLDRYYVHEVLAQCGEAFTTSSDKNSNLLKAGRKIVTNVTLIDKKNILISQFF